MDPLKKIQVEGYAMFAEPELLFGNLDELCCVSSFAKKKSCRIHFFFSFSVTILNLEMSYALNR